MNKTQIEWVQNPDGTPGYTWNPITGCLNGCEYCYARRLANTRLKARYLANNILPSHDELNHEAHHNDPFYPRFWPERLHEPLDKAHLSKNGIDWIEHRQKAKGIFVCDMSDLFGIGVPEAWTENILNVISSSKPTHRFYLLTKQPQNLIKWSPFPENCWVGVTATNQKMYDIGASLLSEIDAKVKYMSLEPLLESIILPYYNRSFDWLILGSQTKPYKPPKIEGVQEIVSSADKANIPVFLKDNLKTAFNTLPFEDNRWFWSGYGQVRQEMPLKESE